MRACGRRDAVALVAKKDCTETTMTTSNRTKKMEIHGYVIHSPALTVREPNVKKLQELGFDRVNLVTSNEPADITADIVKTLVNVQPLPEMQPLFQALLRPLHVNQLSNALKHLTALRMIVESSRGVESSTRGVESSTRGQDSDSWHVVVEDDVLSGNEAMETLRATLKEAPSDADMVFLGLPTTKSGSPEQRVFEEVPAIFKLLPCCDSYAVKATLAAKLLDAFLPIKYPTQVQLSFLIESMNLKAYACSPNVFVDGTKIGAFISSIEQNNMLIWNPQYNEVRRAVVRSDGEPTQEDLEKAQAILDEAHFKEHPDFKYLSSLVLLKAGKIKEARAAFDATFEAYVNEKCVMGPDCQFMKDYVQIFKHFQ